MQLILTKEHIDGTVVIRKGIIQVYAKHAPHMYIWWFGPTTTEKEIDYIRRCVKAKKWLKH